jgi:D-glycero-D-manno-heptose 1,7-bisphosphate phosphatase
MKRKVVFLDRDGVLNVDLGYTYKVPDLRLVNGAIEGLRILSQNNFEFYVVTNQSGVARGLFTLTDVMDFNRAIEKQLNDAGIQLLGFGVCPHHPDGTVKEFSCDCPCRKPKTKLVDDAVEQFKIDKTLSWMIGDKDSDVACGLNAGLKSLQVVAGGKSYKQHELALAKLPTLKEAARYILKHQSC